MFNWNLFFNFLDIWSGLGATLNVAKPKKGSTVAVFGLGAVGLAVSLFISCYLPYIYICDTFTACLGVCLCV